MKRIAVLMTCYNRVRVTLHCLEALFQQELPAGCEIEVFLVDDASPDETGRIVKQKFPQVNVIQGGGSLYWNRGMRLAWDTASAHGDYDYYLWLNDDVVLKKCAISDLFDDYSRTNGVIVGTFSSDEKEADVSYGATRIFPDGKNPRIGDVGMNGNLVLVPREVFKKVGPIYDKYIHQCGDYDYGYMVRRGGFEYFASSKFSGHCPEQPERYLHLKGRSLVGRIRLLFNPKGYCVNDALIYRYRRDGILRAILTLLHVVFIVIFAVEDSK